MTDDVVTSVETNRKGAFVTVNHGQEILYFSRDNWLEKSFSQGDEVDLEEIHQWLLPRQYPEALNYAVSLLALRGRSTGELRKKLLDRHYMEETADMVIYKLEKERFVDDEAFAKDMAMHLSRKRMGKRRIFMELRNKGLSQEMAESAIESLDGEEAMDAAAALARKLLEKYSDESDPRKGMQKLYSAMARRGYSFEESRQAVETSLDALHNEDDL